MATATSAYISNLQKREQIADGTMAFYFARPLHFEFRAGQSIDLTIVNPPQTDAEGNTRTFSIASAPSDADLMMLLACATPHSSGCCAARRRVWK